MLALKAFPEAEIKVAAFGVTTAWPVALSFQDLGRASRD
jgi:hypothetical protein